MPVLSALPSRAEPDRLHQLLAELYAEQLALTPDVPYLVEHARPRIVSGQVAAFRWYRAFLPPSGAVLDWGCNHAPDSCLLRAWAGDRYELHACDFGAPGRFTAFHDFARVAFAPLEHVFQLPYFDAQFDAVLASGVLEHTAMDYESLKELHRVLKPGGVLIITYLPNRLSVMEWVRRNVYRKDYHRRLYGRAETQRLFQHTGFEVLDGRYQATCRGGLFSSVLRPLVPFSSVHCFALRKRTDM